MNRSEHIKRKTMFQFDPNSPVETQVAHLTQEYRNLYDEVEKLRDLVNRHDEILSE